MSPSGIVSVVFATKSCVSRSTSLPHLEGQPFEMPGLFVLVWFSLLFDFCLVLFWGIWFHCCFGLGIGVLFGVFCGVLFFCLFWFCCYGLVFVDFGGGGGFVAVLVMHCLVGFRFLRQGLTV